MPSETERQKIRDGIAAKAMVVTKTKPEPVPDDIVVMARNPEEMAGAQAALTEWAGDKLARARVEHGEFKENYEVAQRNKWRSDLLKRKTIESLHKVEFWEKVKAAIEAGYCIVPALPVDVFAIRTTRKNPKADRSRSTTARIQASNRPALGDGRYVDSSPEIYQGEDYEHTLPNGNTITTRDYWAEAFADVEFPLTVVKPQIMDATGKAMARKIFDDIGVLPRRNARGGDPVIVGRVHYPGTSYGEYGGRRALHFLIAWWIDTKDL